ncbi:uncharacterized protein CCOS01_14101 [Colletotrichum costaricense]|uniref:Uncharacterized protein n=2 Tax=Colletotrichum acutatum species complex TaxID=2707335 RepID=A0A135SBB4_9PEZI|nr:uncharacterized protein CCOS01_14101 [Colletotrichum costaricense]KAK1514161.1 hypothetical protein CCOS01_14101 [Colletotrichum costaricense]KXH33202.1 hypothetical protein CSIM01_07634 [Colletotrichum simmondsii]
MEGAVTLRNSRTNACHPVPQQKVQRSLGGPLWPMTSLHSCTGAAQWPVTCTQRGRGKRKARYDVGGTWHKLEAEPGRLGLSGPCSDFSTSLAIIFPAKALVRTAPPSPTFDLDSIILSSPLFLLSPS